MILASIVFCAAQIGLDQIDFETEVRVRTEHNSLRDSAAGTPESLSTTGIHLHTEAVIPLNEYGNFVVAAHLHADGDDEIETHADFDAYVDVDQMWGDFQMRFGRMHLDYGDGRLISSNPWRFEENVHDALVINTDFIETDFEFFISQADRGLAATFGDKMLGMYSNYAVNSSSAIETYFINRQQEALAVDEYDFASRYYGRTAMGLNYDLMLILQNGSDFGRDITSTAYAVSMDKQLDFGHGVGVGLAVAQGEGSGSPLVRQRYNPIMIDSHKYNGRADILAFSNLMDFSANYWLNWNERWSMHIDAHSFYRQSNADGVYFGEDVTFEAAASRDREIGREIDFYCEGEISDALSIDLGISLFMPQASIAHTQEQFIAYLQVEYIF